jgi:hypothetical protein
MIIKCEVDPVTKQVMGQASVLPEEVVPGEVYFLGMCTEKCYVHNGERIAVPDKPGNGYVWKWFPDFMWVKDVEEVRSEKLKSLKASRDAEEFSEFTYNGLVLDGGVDAQRRLTGLVSAAKAAIAAGTSFAKDFTLADDSVVSFTAEDFVGIEMAKIWQVDAAFTKYRDLKNQVMSATTVAEIEAVTWN